MPTYDPTQAKDSGNFEPIPAGLYRASIAKVVEAETKDQTPMFKLTFRISEGEHYKRLIFDNLVFSGKGMSRVKIMLHALGFSTDQNCDVTPELLTGRDIMIDVIQDVWDGKPVNRIKFDGYHPDGGEVPAF